MEANSNIKYYVKKEMILSHYIQRLNNNAHISRRGRKATIEILVLLAIGALTQRQFIHWMLNLLIREYKINIISITFLTGRENVNVPGNPTKDRRNAMQNTT
jgi:hypothetical protein